MKCFFRYTVQLAAKTQQSHQSPFSKPLYITTTSSKPHIPKIQSISTDYSGSVLITFDYPCPYTGPTKFKIKVECQIDNDCDSDHLDEVDFSIREGEIKVVTKKAIFLQNLKLMFFRLNISHTIFPISSSLRPLLITASVKTLLVKTAAALLADLSTTATDVTISAEMGLALPEATSVVTQCMTVLMGAMNTTVSVMAGSVTVATVWITIRGVMG